MDCSGGVHGVLSNLPDYALHRTQYPHRRRHINTLVAVPRRHRHPFPNEFISAPQHKLLHSTPLSFFPTLKWTCFSGRCFVSPSQALSSLKLVETGLSRPRQPPSSLVISPHPYTHRLHSHRSNGFRSPYFHVSSLLADFPAYRNIILQCICHGSDGTWQRGANDCMN